MYKQTYIRQIDKYIHINIYIYKHIYIYRSYLQIMEGFTTETVILPYILTNSNTYEPLAIDSNINVHPIMGGVPYSE